MLIRPQNRQLQPSKWLKFCRKMTTSVEVSDPVLLYKSRVLQGIIRQDNEQLRALYEMRRVHKKLLDYQPPVMLYTLLESLREDRSNWNWPFQRSALSVSDKGLSSNEIKERDALLNLPKQSRSKQLVKVLSLGEESTFTPGFLLVGPPGTGKSMLLDVFFDSLPTPHKVRFHYHHFLLYLYSKIHTALEKQRLELEAEERFMQELSAKGEGGYPWSRQQEAKAVAMTKGWRAVFAGGRSPTDLSINTQDFILVEVARDLLKTHGWLLAFDEVQLVDITGAGMIYRVLSFYWRLGGVVVGTSNRVPEDLYNSGVQRESISSFLEALSLRSPVIKVESPLDYRRENSRRTNILPQKTPSTKLWENISQDIKAWFTVEQKNEFDATVLQLIGDKNGEQKQLQVYGRSLVIPWCSEGIAKFKFSDLCEAALGPADYITIAANFHTVIISDIPILKLSAKNEARRFITLLDALYEAKTRLVALAESNIDDLFFPDALPGANSIESSTYGYSGPAKLENTEVLADEMLSEVSQELEAPYRPNVSAYDSTEKSKIYALDSARVDVDFKQFKDIADQTFLPIQPHPSAAVPAFHSLAIFTGEEERFAFTRAVSRVHEMCSFEFLQTAEWTPLNEAFRTWEKSKSPRDTKKKTELPSQNAIGPKIELDEDEAIGPVTIKDLRRRDSEGMPEYEMYVDILQKQDGVKSGEPVVIQDHHIWGTREDWGKRAGDWGKGASIYRKK